MFTRRQLLRTGTVAGASAFTGPVLRGDRRTSTEEAPPAAHDGLLDPARIPKYVTPLFVVPPMPPAAGEPGMDVYHIAAREFVQQILPDGFPATTVFGYGSARDPATFRYPGYTIEAIVGRPVRVTWANQLMSSSGKFRPHLLPVDPSILWANPPGGVHGRDSRPTFRRTPGPYRGPVPFVTHLHGGHNVEESDGYPEAWYLPPARDIPLGFARVGTVYERYREEARERTGVVWKPGSAVFQYANDQRATTLWYHSHELGLTRLNVYAGLAGLYLLRGGLADLPAGVLPGPAPRLSDLPGSRAYEVPLVIADRSFTTDGSLFFPRSRGFFGDVPPEGPFVPTTDVPPIWNPEFFGTTMVVNGTTWPAFEVEPRRYRLRLLNACNTRTLILKIVTDPLAPRPVEPAVPLWMLGSDGGFLPTPVPLDSVLLGVGERADVLVDLTGLRPGTGLYLINEGPDEPYGGGTPGVTFAPADPATTGQVMRLEVIRPASVDTSVPPDQLRLPTLIPLGPATRTRQVSMNEMESVFFADAPTEVLLGTLDSTGAGRPLPWDAPVTEDPELNSTEIWELHNFTNDGHPIHLHLVQFQVLNRQRFDGPVRPAESSESGYKDTVLALPGEITRIKATFDQRGQFVWHCHILDHEDSEMMRPYHVGPPSGASQTHAGQGPYDR